MIYVFVFKLHCIYIFFICIGFLYFYGSMTLVITSIVAIFKKEKDSRLEDGYVNINVFQNYKLLWDILKLPRIRVLALALLTTRVNINLV